MLELLTPSTAADWLHNHVTGALRTDSRQVQPGDGFIAWPGAATDARLHVASALASGAVACLVELDGAEPFEFNDARVAGFAHLKAGSGPIAAAYYGFPVAQLDVLAVTGTNGKTSTAWWLAQALSNLKQAALIPCGLVGTLGVGVVPDLVTTGMTTPDPVLLQQTFRHFVDTGITACAIEVSSIGLEEHRMDGTPIRTAIFTNLTQDHLDYHGSMEAYWLSKARLFQWPGLQAAVINIDDPQGAALALEVCGSVADLWTVSCIGPARLQAQEIGYNAQGLRYTVVEGDARHVLQTQMIGTYNVSNLLGVIAAMRSIGVPLAAAIDACSRLTPVPGRMECLGAPGQPLVAVDYAHTPDALGKALEALRSLAEQRGGKLWCVFGCGGDRDTVKRPLMGAVAGRFADEVVVTSDNPRSENPDVIIAQILLGLKGCHNVMVEPDRALAIAQTLSRAAANDVLLIAGKGHEDYQEIAGQRFPFSDLIQVRQHIGVNDMMTLAQTLPWLGESRLVTDATEGGAVIFRRVHTDTRTLQPGDLFVALQGERFDANDFLAEARAKGAVAAICQGDADDRLRAAGLPGVVVPDAKRALAALATGWRAQFSLPLIAVTGSNGKTTVTQMIAAILKADQPHAFLATQGNLNNEIGVPLTLLRLRRSMKLAVVELGMNHPDEIATLSAMAQPTVALVNNAQREHLEFMETVEAVAQENGAVIDALPANGVAVFPSDDLFTGVWAAKAGQRAVLTFGAAEEAQAPAAIRCTEALWVGDAWQVTAATPAGELSYALHIAGQHNVKNSLAAVACALAAGVPLASIAQGLSDFLPVKGRSRAVVVSLKGRDITLVDDTYNANPDSVQAAIHVLASLPAPRLLVLGDMGEVGDQGPQFHAEAGALAHTLGIEVLFTLGELAVTASQHFGAGQHFADMAALQSAVLAHLPEVGSVLVKGSRFMKMERVVDAITVHAQQDKDKNHAA
ncbi:MAG: bifunctional UDP-N-acetylmuramoyl-L-alanyl-D-glutamate--2,6-diaminopimelate ligase MurE/UDP-N-acetylmuramoyl-tripeptide--D-alanyl-D-alanine ligase MurF [Rhodoferax sp.]|uniref:bifunctional UDP-N-acetylmuramoyl-L-alanyl-D-glutamate--2, 6-diaminopimelate ligase MurE/UDP-N-acetylmuramoyl-tripeptide--D-alanyl-D-alanine ligase MurF n=1 Tax=Rhodoferax sp. TaxID=50421 RepID=UPI0030171DC6